mmetsp:Transcript_98805/g.313623  ORF Transcript_98805/g.313623 Transcript_98805/m.313623 type:complete len:331 (+) Transcript_98805:623-1615(+)
MYSMSWRSAPAASSRASRRRWTASTECFSLKRKPQRPRCALRQCSSTRHTRQRSAHGVPGRKPAPPEALRSASRAAARSSGRPKPPATASSRSTHTPPAVVSECPSSVRGQRSGHHPDQQGPRRISAEGCPASGRTTKTSWPISSASRRCTRRKLRDVLVAGPSGKYSHAAWMPSGSASPGLSRLHNVSISLELLLPPSGGSMHMGRVLLSALQRPRRRPPAQRPAVSTCSHPPLRIARDRPSAVRALRHRGRRHVARSKPRPRSSSAATTSAASGAERSPGGADRWPGVPAGTADGRPMRLRQPRRLRVLGAPWHTICVPLHATVRCAR